MPKISKSKCGNKVTDTGFSPAGWTGKDYNLFASYLNKGWKELYYSAPYYWGVVNLKTKKIFTYTEGDITLVECKTKQKFICEINSYVKFLKESGYSESVYGEVEGILNKLK